MLLTAVIALGIAMEWGGLAGSALPEWEVKWSSAAVPAVEDLNEPGNEWLQVAGYTSGLEAPDGKTAMWLRITLPKLNSNSALLIDKIYGNEIRVFENNALIYSSHSEGNLTGTKVLIPLAEAEPNSRLYVWSSGGDHPAGIKGYITTGDYGRLLSFYVKRDLIDMILGAALIFTAAVFAVCSIFLKRALMSSGIYLILVILSSGVLLVAHSPFLPLIFGGSGRLVEAFFNLALFTLLLSFISFFEGVFGSGEYAAVSRFRKFLTGYVVLCAALWVLNLCLSYRLDGLYRVMAVDIAGVLMILQMLFLLGLAVRYAFRGKLEAVIFAAGLFVFTSIALTEGVLYYATEGEYLLFWWKWGLIALVISLVIILARGFIISHQQVVQYSYELEKFNNDLQRSEKMGIISELAASVAHEVKNPLQVTRGFLQILGERSGEKEKEYLKMAITELDRASLIITDFLTFAKPEMETVDLLDLSEELEHVAGILLPLANLQNAEIILKLQAGLYVQGSSSKLKQAFINIIKNSIESLHEDGLITITLWKSGNHNIISVRDNGEGMKSSELARLGEPYYSNKSKGTGLGLMVTFRIIEAMGGGIKFHSLPGEGTEVIFKLPAGSA